MQLVLFKLREPQPGQLGQSCHDRRNFGKLRRRDAEIDVTGALLFTERRFVQELIGKTRRFPRDLQQARGGFSPHLRANSIFTV
jgi:hypothetical protein